MIFWISTIFFMVLECHMGCMYPYVLALWKCKMNLFFTCVHIFRIWNILSKIQSMYSPQGDASV